MENKNTFLETIHKGIDNGEYDNQLNLPFMNKKLFYNIIKGKINKKIETKGTPVLNNAEIKNIIEDMKEIAGSTFYIFVKSGILEKTEEGYKLSKKGQIALYQSTKKIK